MENGFEDDSPLKKGERTWKCLDWKNIWRKKKKILPTALKKGEDPLKQEDKLSWREATLQEEVMLHLLKKGEYSPPDVLHYQRSRRAEPQMSRDAAGHHDRRYPL